MKGIYLTEEGKKEIEDKIAEFEQDSQFWLNRSIKNIGNPEYNSFSDSICKAQADQAAYLLREILSLATILPVEENWKSIIKGDDDYVNYIENIICFPTEYPNGIIIENKQHEQKT